MGKRDTIIAAQRRLLRDGSGVRVFTYIPRGRVRAGVRYLGRDGSFTIPRRGGGAR